ncbi:MAG: hypothetical protein WAU78_08250 [Roseiarcus sp.]
MFAAQGEPLLPKGLPGPHTLAARHSALTRSCGLRTEDGLCVACGGVYPHGGWLEAWLACRPEAAAHIVGVVKTLRLTVLAIAETEHIEIRARVAAGWAPGARLARLLGFRHKETIGGVETWILEPPRENGP